MEDRDSSRLCLAIEMFGEFEQGPRVARLHSSPCDEPMSSWIDSMTSATINAQAQIKLIRLMPVRMFGLSVWHSARMRRPHPYW
jgi:hypothetical protein